MDNWVIIDENDIVHNVIVWNGEGNLGFPEGWTWVQAPGAKIGWYWNDGNQIKPEETTAISEEATTTIL